MDEEELLYALWAMEVLTSSGIGLETAIKHVAENDYGEVSSEFKKVLKKLEEGEKLEIALVELMNKTQSKGFKKALAVMIRSLKGEGNVADALKTIAQRETEERKVRLKNFVEKLNPIAEIFILVSILVPIILVVVIFTDMLIEQSGMGRKIMENPLCASYLLIGVIIVLLGIATAVKNMERGL